MSININSIIKTIQSFFENELIINSKEDLLVLFIHSIFISNNFKLIGLEEKKESDKNDEILEKLPLNWNSSPNVWSFLYQNDKSCLTFLIKCIKLMNTLTINSMICESEKIYTIQIPIKDIFTDKCEFPIKELNANMFNIESLNIVKGNIEEEIIYKIIPGMENNYEKLMIYDNKTPNNNEESIENDVIPKMPQRIPSSNNPVNPNFRGGNFDLDPFTSIGPSGGGGMIVGPNNPIFSDFDINDNQRNDFFGGPTTLPPGAVPVGSRFDPIGPFGPQSSRPSNRGFGGYGRGGMGRGGLGRGGFNIRSYEPDNDDLPPPGYNDMFM